MTLQQLQYFRTLAKVQHYTKAAEILFVSQPSLSYAISELEKELSLALFERHGKKIQLSAQGKIFLTYVESALDQLEKGVVTIKSLNPLGGAVRLGYIYSLSNSFIRELCGFFLMKKTILSLIHQREQQHSGALMLSIDLAILSNRRKMHSAKFP